MNTNNFNGVSNTENQVINFSSTVRLVNKCKIETATGVTVEIKDDTLEFSFDEPTVYSKVFPDCKEPQTQALFEFARILSALCSLQYKENDTIEVQAIIEKCLTEDLSQYNCLTEIDNITIKKSMDFAKLFIRLDTLYKYNRETPLSKKQDEVIADYFENDQEAFMEQQREQTLLTHLNQWCAIYESFPQACQTFLNIDTIQHAEEFVRYYYSSEGMVDSTERNKLLELQLLFFMKQGYICENSKLKESNLQRKKKEENAEEIIAHQAIFLIATFFMPDEYKQYRDVTLELCKRPQGMAEYDLTKESLFYNFAKVDENLMANWIFHSLHSIQDPNKRKFSIRRLKQIEQVDLKLYLQKCYEEYCIDKKPLLRFYDAPQPLLNLGFDCPERAKCMLGCVTEMSEEDKDKLIWLMFPDLTHRVTPSSITWDGAKQTLADFIKSFKCCSIVSDKNWKIIETYFVIGKGTPINNLKNSQTINGNYRSYKQTFDTIKEKTKKEILQK